MALIVEDGSGVAGANTYATRQDLIEYAALRGLDLSGESVSSLDAALIRAMDYLEAQPWQGERVSSTQALAWPRADVWLHQAQLPSTFVPRELVYGQLALAIEARTQDLQPNPTGKGSVIEETVSGAVTVRYSSDKPAMVTSWSKAQAIIQPLLRRGGLYLTRA
jgi:hypothetical protein